MRYDNLRAFEKHLEGSSPHHFSSLYFILGKESFECHEAVELLLRFLLPSPQEREFALQVFEGSRLDKAELWTALYSNSFFAKSRVIWIQQADKLKKSLQEDLEKYFARPLPAHYLILSASHWQKNTAFYKAAEKEGIILEIAEIKPWEKEKRLAEWINKQAAEERRLMAFPVCQALVKQVGNDQALLAQELEKLLIYCGDKKEISQKDVEAICTRLQNDSIWQLGEAIFRRDSALAWQMADAFLTEGQALLPLLRQIRSQFQTEYQICLLLAQGKQAADINQEFPYMKGAILEKHLKLAQQYGLENFKQGILAIDAAEMRTKNSSVDEKILFEQLMIQLTQSIYN